MREQLNSLLRSGRSWHQQFWKVGHMMHKLFFLPLGWLVLSACAVASLCGIGRPLPLLPGRRLPSSAVWPPQLRAQRQKRAGRRSWPQAGLTTTSSSRRTSR